MDNRKEGDAVKSSRPLMTPNATNKKVQQLNDREEGDDVMRFQLRQLAAHDTKCNKYVKKRKALQIDDNEEAAP